MTDSFMQNHQSALDSLMEDKAIQDLEDAGIYPVPDNDDILERLFEEAYDEIKEDNILQLDDNDVVLENLYNEAYDYFSKQHPNWEEERICHVAEKSAKRQFEELPEPLDNS